MWLALSQPFPVWSSRTQKTISLSSCESELHSLVSSMCDGLFIIACAQFVLGEKVVHVQFTDSSSARQAVKAVDELDICLEKFFGCNK